MNPTPAVVFLPFSLVPEQKDISCNRSAISCNDPHQADALKLSYMDARDNYHGLPITDYHKFDTELVSSILK